ncbi:MAG: SGNH/GDSL hydrolase family protein [Verrucomicrobia bacterium]|nr:SGNH/GDSL hydrolase family protein [Verrucomicrobiota bacterium]
MKCHAFRLIRYLGTAVCVEALAIAAWAAAPADLDRLQARLKDKGRPMTWVLTGDSITLGARHLRTARSYPELLSERVRYEMKRRRDLFVNSGVDGESIAGLLADFDWRVRRFAPDVVSVMIGMNDSVGGPRGRAEFERRLRLFVERVRSCDATVILHTTNPIDVARVTNRDDLPSYNRIVMKVAASEHVILVDHWTHWQSMCPELPLLRGWLDDPFHPNARGHREFAVQMMKALGVFEPGSAIIQIEDHVLSGGGKLTQ